MAFTPEDGTCIEDANSFVLLAFANDYFQTRGIVAWTGSDTVKEQALIKATDYIEKVYYGRFKGEQKSTTQGLSFPRVMTGFGEMPLNLLKATCEYALRALLNPLLPDITTDPSGFPVKGVSTRVGPIQESLWFATETHMNPDLTKSYMDADLLMRPLLIHNARVVR